MSRKSSYTTDQFNTLLNTLPESSLRNLSSIHIESPKSDPRFVLVMKSNSGVSVDLKPGSVSIESIGYSKDGMIRLSVLGDISVDLATDILSEINFSALFTGFFVFSSYNFFVPSNTHLTRSHFVMTRNSETAVRVSSVNDKAIDKLEFVSIKGNIELIALVNTKAYRSITDYSFNSGSFDWKKVKTDSKIRDLSIRLVDDQVTVLFGTSSGIKMYRDEKLSSYKGTKDISVTTIDAGYTGIIDSVDSVSDDSVGRVIGFTTSDGTLMTTPMDISSTTKPTLLASDISSDINRLISSDTSWFVGYGESIVKTFDLVA